MFHSFDTERRRRRRLRRRILTSFSEYIAALAFKIIESQNWHRIVFLFMLSMISLGKSFSSVILAKWPLSICAVLLNKSIKSTCTSRVSISLLFKCNFYGKKKLLLFFCHSHFYHKFSTEFWNGKFVCGSMAEMNFSLILFIYNFHSAIKINVKWEKNDSNVIRMVWPSCTIYGKCSNRCMQKFFWWKILIQKQLFLENFNFKTII